jgi:cbb3-type cytochrome oxidase cytochrome c subunit
MNQIPRRVPVVFLAGFFLLVQTGRAQTKLPADLDDQYRAGLVADYQAADGSRCRRVDSRLAFSWQQAGPDPRLTPGPFSVTWQGYLMSQVNGPYRLAAYVNGQLQLKLNGQLLLDGQTSEAGWLVSKPIELPFDWHPLSVTYRSKSATGKLVLYWTGPGFQWEPVDPRQWYHDPARTIKNRFERGHQLVRALRCTQCHEIPGQPPTAKAPSLQHLQGTMQPGWLISRLAGSHHADPDQRQMPDFDLNRSQAEAIVAYLWSQSKSLSLKSKQPVKPAKKNNGKKKGDKPRTTAEAKAGQQLLMTTGCLACHQVEELGTANLFGGGSLSKVADKRTGEFFASWLEAPQRINPQHRMPTFELTPLERLDLAEYLKTLTTADTDQAGSDGKFTPQQVEQGKSLMQKFRCTSCHEANQKIVPAAVTARLLGPKSKWQTACSGTGQVAATQPRYRLLAADRAAVQEFVGAVAQAKPGKQPATVDAVQLLREQNCLACHARYEEAGIVPGLPKVAAAHTALASLLPAMTPPSLNSVGDKLHDQALKKVIQRQGPVHRPWLHVRMPRFPLTETQVTDLVEHLVATDRIAAGGPVTETPLPAVTERVVQAAGRRLVTTAGFGCTSCHEIGGVKPVKAPLNARGPDLSGLSTRLRREWFDRFVRNPIRMVPRMEMPSIKLAVKGVLDDHLDQQLDAVWRVLNQPGFKPPSSGAVRIVRRSGVADRHELSAVLTDVLHVGSDVYVKPLLIGLPNRHNVLFDLQTNRLVGWWQGDVAHQRTQGKTWFWDVPEKSWITIKGKQSQLQLQLAGRRLAPVAEGQFLTQLDQWQQIKGGIQFRRRLHFDTGSTEKLVVTVQERLTSLPSSGRLSGWRRQLEVFGVPAGAALLLRVAEPEQLPGKKIDLAARQIDLLQDGGVQIRLPGTGGTLAADGWLQVPGSSKPDQPVRLDLVYTSDFPVDRFPQLPPSVKPSKPVALSIVPGFDSVRLPLVGDLMPTAMSWDPAGRLFFTSLKGRVWRGVDTNNDGMEDQVSPFSDELAAPFGIAAHADHVDVINKYALLRLFDDNRDGRADRVVTLASGWGHTTDYHDWAIGLPRDKQGNYYIAMACQQDDRSLAAAHLRGTVLKLVPQAPTSSNPQAFRLEKLTAGHRFPTGIARNRQGQLFVTDNQGNYNPFNELNHVVAGARYGFLNKVERRDGFAPPLTPPAIDIPHPWTRSVNGICFLETPARLLAEGSGSRFGPFEGHLVGCEYDTRRLVRMSLQRVGETIQGAVYPFSFDVAGEQETFVGPLSCAVSPRGELYVGCIRDSGWGGGNNIGSLVQMRFNAKQMVAGIAEVRAQHHGFKIVFTRPVDRQRAASLENYSVISYTRVSTPAYGGSDKDRRIEKPSRAVVAADGMSVELHLNDLRQGFVYEFRLKDLAGSAQQPFHPAEAYYTLRTIPR